MTAFPMHPTTSSPTTNVTKNIAFSTNSNSSTTLYQDAEMIQSNSSSSITNIHHINDQNQQPNQDCHLVEAHGGSNQTSSNMATTFKQPMFNQRPTPSFNNFISTSAPSYSSSEFHFNYNDNTMKNRLTSGNQFQKQQAFVVDQQQQPQTNNNINNNNQLKSTINTNTNNNITHSQLHTQPPQQNVHLEQSIQQLPPPQDPISVPPHPQMEIPTSSTSGKLIDISTHDVEDLLMMLSALLQKIVDANDLLHADGEHPNAKAQQLGEGDKRDDYSQRMLNSKYSANVLAFHGRNVPAISLHAYLTRILKYCPVTNDVFLTLLVYFDRIAKRANNDTNGPMDDNSNSSKQQQIFVMDSFNIHRLIISGITVASKFFSDVFYKNSRYAKVGGLPLDELNHLELQMLLLLDFELLIQKEELERYGDLLIKFWKRENNEKP